MEGYFLRDEEESLSQPCGDGNKTETSSRGFNESWQTSGPQAHRLEETNLYL